MSAAPKSQSSVMLAPHESTSERDGMPVETFVVSFGSGGSGPGWDLNPTKSAILPPFRRAISAGDKSPGWVAKNDAGSENTPKGAEGDMRRSSGLNAITLWLESDA